ncbi:hypothetical protein D3C77_754280 [compost metagenome]
MTEAFESVGCAKEQSSFHRVNADLRAVAILGHHMGLHLLLARGMIGQYFVYHKCAAHPLDEQNDR